MLLIVASATEQLLLGMHDKSLSLHGCAAPSNAEVPGRIAY
jgi:hypothetical protein